MPDDTLDRFVQAQETIYQTALGEIRRGRKRSHWMWFIFPQISGLGHSPTARHYAIRSLEEAGSYLNHSVLGPRYLECVAALQDLAASDPVAVFGATDATKLKSSLTLFDAVRPQPLFGAAIQRWFGGERDARTLDLLQTSARRAALRGRPE